MENPGEWFRNRIVFYLDLSFSLVYFLFYLFLCYLLMIKDRRSDTFCGEKYKIGDTKFIDIEDEIFRLVCEGV